jgi:hypothetical protein
MPQRSACFAGLKSEHLLGAGCPEGGIIHAGFRHRHIQWEIRHMSRMMIPQDALWKKAKKSILVCKSYITKISMQGITVERDGSCALWRAK